MGDPRQTEFTDNRLLYLKRLAEGAKSASFKGLHYTAIVGDRLRDWAENSDRLMQVIVEMAQNAAARGDIPDEDMPHRIWLRRQVAQGWVMMVKLDSFLHSDRGRPILTNVGFAGAVAGLLSFFALFIL